ncbi:MAG: FtsX-like permease family protein [Arenicellales bacterium]|nr:FtsX-like permease family protein [Arenicellales bacterium]
MKIWSIALRSLRREWRGGELRIVALALTIATTAVVSVASFGDRLHQTLARQGSELLGADLVVHVQAPPKSDWIVRADELGLRHARVESFRSVVVAGEYTQLAEIKAVENGYPLRGILRIADSLESIDRPANGVPDPGEVWVDAQLLTQLHLNIGDSVDLGKQRFKITRLLTLEPDRGGVAFTMAPRLMLNLEDLPATGLVQPGSLVHYHWLVAGSEQQIQVFKDWMLARGLLDTDLRDASNAQPRFRVALDRGESFLLLATLVSVLLAGIAIARSVRHYAQRQWDNAAVMRCFGARQNEITAIYVTQLLVLALAVSLLGAALGFLGQQVFVNILSGLVAGELPLPTWRPVALGVAVGVITVIGFGLPPLLRLKDVPPLRVIRRDLGVLPVRARLVYGIAFISFAVLVIWTAKQIGLILWVLGGTVATILVLSGVSLILIRLLARSRASVHVSWRFGIAAIARHARSSTSQIVALGIGIMAILLLTMVRADLWEQWQISLPPDTPNHFLINIQPDQLSEVESFFEQQGLVSRPLTPIVRARLISINGRTVDPEDYRDGFARRQVQRAANLSWAEELQPDNKVVQGKWWSSEQFKDGLLSVELGYAEALGLKLGDELVYRIGDKELSVAVSNYRTVAWDSFRPNFFLLVPPDLLTEFPSSYITSLYLPREQNAKIREIIERFPNITDIDVDALLGQVRRVLNKVNTALQFIFVFTLGAGLVVLWAALTATRSERRKEIAVLRALGARSADLRLGLIAEFVVLGSLAGSVGAFAAAVTGWGLSKFLFELPYEANIVMWFVGVLLAVLLVVSASYLAIRADLKTPPWQSLRESD